MSNWVDWSDPKDEIRDEMKRLELMLKQIDVKIENTLFRSEHDALTRERAKLLGQLKECARNLAYLKSE